MSHGDTYELGEWGPPLKDRIFVGVFPTGIAYADRQVERDGDYKPLGFLSFSTLNLTVRTDCPPVMAAWIKIDARAIQARRGEQYPVDCCSHTVRLGA